MTNRLMTSDIIENLVSATYGENGSALEKRLLRESLLSLVRMAKSEQMLELKENVSKLSGVDVTSKALLRGNGLKRSDQIQHQFDFPYYH